MKTIIILVIMLLFFLTAKSQSSFNLNNPNLIFKDKYGNVISLDSVRAIVNKGFFSMSKKFLSNGKTEMTITPMDNKDLTKKENLETKWINKWKGLPFPNFEMKTLENKIINRLNLKGKVTVFNFWFIKCGPCVKEIPKLSKLVDKYQDKPIQFIAPSAFDSQNELVTFLNKKTFKYKIVTNEISLLKKMKIQTFPTHIIVDKNGIIKDIIIGFSDNIYEKLEAKIKSTIHDNKK